MFNHIYPDARIKVYVDGGADFTGDFRDRSEGLVRLVASNGKTIVIRQDAIVAVVAL